MDPISALTFALAAAWWITKGASETAASQARHEAHAAAEAIRNDLRARRQDWAQRLHDRIADGRRGGPATGLWWAWAAARTGSAVRAALRREPKPDEPARSVRSTTGPWRRIADATVGGARMAWKDAQRRKASRSSSNEKATEDEAKRTPLAVCGNCGAIVARKSLEPAAGPSGAFVQMCVTCRAARAAAENRTANDNAKANAPEDIVDAETVPDVQPTDSGGPPPDSGTPPTEPSQPTAPLPPAAPAAPPAPHRSAPQPYKPRPAGPSHRLEEPARKRAPQEPRQAPTGHIDQPVSPLIEGEPMPAHLVPRSARLPVRPGPIATSGESYTHGEWERAVDAIRKELEQLPAALEAMLRSLSTADAGRSQVTGVVKLHHDTALFVTQITEMLQRVNKLELPILNAVEAAGGPDEIASIRYLSDV